jgi:hypothetical protein
MQTLRVLKPVPFSIVDHFPQFPLPGLSWLDASLFVNCSSLSSIQIPSCVGRLCATYFWGCESVSTLEFDCGSHLSIMEASIISRWASLHSFSLPSGLAELSPLALTGSGLREVSIGEGNRLFKVEGHLVIDFGCRSIKFVFGHEEDMKIGNQIEISDADCFERSRTVLGVTFESDCQLSCIGTSAFCSCSFLRSIGIPSSVRTLCET